MRVPRHTGAAHTRAAHTRAARTRGAVAAAALSALVLALVSACGGSSAPVAGAAKLEKTSLVVATTPAESATPLFIAAQQGIFAAHGLKVTIDTKDFPSTTDMLPDLLDGKIDAAAGQVTTFIAAQAQGQGPFRLLASGLELGPNVNAIITLPGSGINSPDELAGKTIAVNAATGDGPLLTDALLATYGMTASQVHFKVMPFTQMQTALAQHQVDAAYVTEPYLTEIQQQLGAVTVADLDQGAATTLLAAGVTVTAAWEHKYPHTAQALAASLDQAAQIADTNLTADQRAFEVYLDTSQNVADVMATGTFPTSVSVQKLQQVADLMLTYGELAKSFNAASMVGRP